MDVWQLILSFSNGIEAILAATASDPLYYSIVFFIHVVLATVILPIPVELGLLLSPSTPALVLALVLGLGRVVGCITVFYAGEGVGNMTRLWFFRWKWSRRLLEELEWLMWGLNYLGLYSCTYPSCPTLYRPTPSPYRTRGGGFRSGGSR